MKALIVVRKPLQFTVNRHIQAENEIDIGMV